MYGDGLARGKSAGELADDYVAELKTGRHDPMLEQAVSKMLGVQKGATARGKRDGTGPYQDSYQRGQGPGIGRRQVTGEPCPVHIETLQDAMEVLQGIIDGRR